MHHAPYCHGHNRQHKQPQQAPTGAFERAQAVPEQATPLSGAFLERGSGCSSGRLRRYGREVRKVKLRRDDGRELIDRILHVLGEPEPCDTGRTR